MCSVHLSRNSRALFRPFILSCAMVIIIHAAMAYPAVAAETVAEEGAISITTLEIRGLVHTKEDTIQRLLPRPIPAQFTRAELAEFERRIRNLSLFDRVSVAAHGGSVTVNVQEKLTLSPILSFTSGTSVKDLNATAGLVEYNV
ncbi:MAG: hypothetical protein M3M98_07090, partial [Nitrospirota bacterium]|nr:hypothetical protein [Nitrospirota bacterium]